MAVTDEVKAVIKLTATEAADKAVAKALASFEEKHELTMQLHEEKCPGRRMGKVVAIVAGSGILAGIVGDNAWPVLKVILDAMNGQ